MTTDIPLFYYLDGDRIGVTLESHFLRGAIVQASDFSRSVTAALEEIAGEVRTAGGTLHYYAGDNLLFSGRFTRPWCENLLALFHERTGNTASIGIGRTGSAFYSALKEAKSRGGGQIVLRGPVFFFDDTAQHDKGVSL